jgi:hypothetical protein
VPDDRKEFAADLGHRSAAERRDGLSAAAIEAVRTSLGLVKKRSASPYNETIPYRFVLVNGTAAKSP